MFGKKHLIWGCATALLLSLMITACGGNEAEVAAKKQEVVDNYAEIVYASYEDSHTAAVDMQSALETFVADPTAETHQAAKDAWLAAREPYGQTEAYRFYGGPIDDEEDLNHPVWAGVIPIARHFGPTVDSDDNLEEQRPENYSEVFSNWQG